MISSVAARRRFEPWSGGPPLPRILRRPTVGRRWLTLGCLFHLRIFEFHRCCATEDRDRYAQARPVLVDLFDRTVEAGERAIDDPYRLAHLEGDGGLGTLDALLDGPDDPGDFAFRNRHRFR